MNDSYANLWTRRRAVRSRIIACLLGATASAAAASGENPPLDSELQRPLERRMVLRAALLRNPLVQAFRQRVQALRISADGEGALPPPEIRGEVWQVPISSPGRLDAQMIMVSVTQNVPAPGALGARAQAVAAQAKHEEAIGSDKARLILREAGHAFSDYEESWARHRVHRAHLAVTHQLETLASARHGAGGALSDVARAQVELSRLQADVVADAAKVESARFRLNALLGRAPEAPLGVPMETEPMIAAWDVTTLLARARASRPELKAALAEREARELTATAASREATWPSMSLGALYFPPTAAMPQHGYGASVALALPWLWGGAASRRDAAQKLASAAATEADAARYPVDLDVVTAAAAARGAAVRLQVLRDRTRSASRHALEVAQAGYESGRTDLIGVLDAGRMVIDVEDEIASSRGALAHALTELEAAVGTDIPLRTLPALDPAVLEGGASDAEAH